MDAHDRNMRKIKYILKMLLFFSTNSTTNRRFEILILSTLLVAILNNLEFKYEICQKKKNK